MELKLASTTRLHRPILQEVGRENLYRRLIEHVNEAVWAGDADECTVFVNQAFLSLTEYTYDECMQMKSFDFFTSEDQKIVMNETAKRKKNIGSHYEVQVLTKSGQKIPVLVSGAPTGDGGTIGILRDLREIKRREAHERHLAAVLENSVDAIVGLDLNRKVTVWNRGAKLLFGYSTEEMLGNSIDIIVPPKLMAEGEIERMRLETNNRGFLRNFQTVRLTKDGRHIPVSISQCALRDEKGNITEYSVIYRDISEQKRWEEELQNRFDKIQAAYLEMGRQRRYLDYLHELLELALGKHTYGDLPTFIVNAFLMISQVDAVTLRKFEPSKKQFKLLALSGLGQDWWSKKYVPLEGGLHGKAIFAKRPIKILDIWSEPLYPSPGLARKYNLRSLLLIPLFSQDEILGTVALYLHQGNNLGLLDNEFISIFAKEVAVVMKLSSGHSF